MDTKKPRPVKPAWHDGTTPVEEYTVTSDTGYASLTDKLFDITCVVGSVYGGGNEDPRVVAFKMIAAHNTEGTFTFPSLDGDIIEVNVRKYPEKQQ